MLVKSEDLPLIDTKYEVPNLAQNLSELAYSGPVSNKDSGEPTNAEKVCHRVCFLCKHVQLHYHFGL